MNVDSLKDSAQRAVQPLWRLVQPAWRVVQPLWRAMQLWADADGLRMSAAMSFYGMLSLAPLLLLLVGVMGWWMDRSYLETSLIGQVQGVMGPRVAEVVRQALDSAQAPDEGRLASLLGFVVLVSGATGVFVELQAALERLWLAGHPAPERDAWWRMASLRLRGLAYVMALGFLLLTSLALSTLVKIFATWLSAQLAMASLGPILEVLNEVVAFVVAVALFVGLMRIGVGAKPPMRCIVMGAVIGATLFTLGKQLLAWYLSTAAIVSAYGAAGSMVVLLMWIYFSAAVLLFAASCARALEESDGPTADGASARSGEPAGSDESAESDLSAARG